MSKVVKGIVLINLISAIISNCHGLLSPNLKGRIIVSVFTGYDVKGNINMDLIPQQAEFFVKRNVKNIQIMGFYGQGPILSLEDKKAMALGWKREANRLNFNLYIEIGVMPFPDQVELAKFCSKLNVSAISAFPILVYEAKTKEQLIEDYQRLSDAAPNIPLLYRGLTVTDSKIKLPEAFVTLMGRVKTFRGAVMSDDDALDILASVPSVKDYLLIAYGNRAIASALATNLNGTVTNIVNLCPKAVLLIEALVEAGKIKEAFDVQQKLNRLTQAIVSNHGKIIAYIRYMRATCHIFHGMDLGERLPFDKVTPAELDKIRCNLKEFEDFINCYCK